MVASAVALFVLMTQTVKMSSGHSTSTPPFLIHVFIKELYGQEAFDYLQQVSLANQNLTTVWPLVKDSFGPTFRIEPCLYKFGNDSFCKDTHFVYPIAADETVAFPMLCDCDAKSTPVPDDIDAPGRSSPIKKPQIPPPLGSPRANSTTTKPEIETQNPEITRSTKWERGDPTFSEIHDGGPSQECKESSTEAIKLKPTEGTQPTKGFQHNIWASLIESLNQVPTETSLLPCTWSFKIHNKSPKPKITWDIPITLKYMSQSLRTKLKPPQKKFRQKETPFPVMLVDAKTFNEFIKFKSIKAGNSKLIKLGDMNPPIRNVSRTVSWKDKPKLKPKPTIMWVEPTTTRKAITLPISWQMTVQHFRCKNTSTQKY